MIALAFLLSGAASVGLAVVYALGGQTQLEGVLLFVALGGIALGLVAWSRRYLPHGPFEQDREEYLGHPIAEAHAERDFESGAEPIERRRFITGLLGFAVAALGAAAVFPVRSLGKGPGRALFRTSWRRGSHLVTSDGRRVKASDLTIGSVITVFPEGHTDAADSQTLLIRLADGEYKPPAGREDWSPQGFVAFSKVCTHAGCPVGLYAAESHELFCPCHQSAFDVLKAAKPIAGPAARPLPQLPLRIDKDGFIVARSDYHEPIGPGFWSRDRA